MSSSYVVSLSSFNLLFFTQVLTVLTSSMKYNDYVTDKGKNISIPCSANGSIMWVKESGNNTTIIQTGKFLVLTNVTASDRGIYVCFASMPPQQAAPQHDVNATEVNTAVQADGSVDSSDSPEPVVKTDGIRQQSNSTQQSVTVQATATTVRTTIETIELAKSSEAIRSSKTPQQAATVATATPVIVASSVYASSASPPSHDIAAAGSSAAPLVPPTKSIIEEQQQAEMEQYEAVMKVNLTVRTPPGPVTQLYFKASTVLGFLIWRFNKTNSGGYPLRSFTAEFRNVSYVGTSNGTRHNASFNQHEWTRMDPINIAPNVRQMEVYRLEPNTTYEFRIWANNQLGSGEMVTTNVTTLPETKEEEFEDGWDGIELIPNIILNPGFCETDGHQWPYARTVIFREDDGSESYESEESDHEPRLEKFKRKVSVFFTGPGPTIKRI